MTKAWAAAAERRPGAQRTSAAEKAINRCGIMAPTLNGCTLFGASGLAIANPSRNRRFRAKILFRQADVGAVAVTIRVRAQCQIDSLSRVLHVEVRGSAKGACPPRSVSALEPAAARHVEFINDPAAFHVGNPDMKRENGATGAKTSEEKSTQRAAAINKIKLSFHQPANARRFVAFQNARGRYLLELFLQIAGKFNGREGFADRHLAVRVGFVTLEHGGIDAERTNVNRAWGMRAHATICGHV